VLVVVIEKLRGIERLRRFERRRGLGPQGGGGEWQAEIVVRFAG
jgi:hypothetical protein